MTAPAPIPRFVKLVVGSTFVVESTVLNARSRADGTMILCVPNPGFGPSTTKSAIVVRFEGERRPRSVLDIRIMARSVDLHVSAEPAEI